MNLYEQLERTPCLGPCEKVKAGEIIKLLGLRHTSNRKGKPYFQTETAREFYECTQIVVDHDTRSRSRQEYLEEIRNPVSSLFDHEAKELLGNFGNRVYGQNRSHVIVATMDGDDHPVEPLYPSNLFFSNPRDYARILLYVRCWIANRALRKASSTSSKPSFVLSQSRETSVSTDHDHRIRLDDEERILEHEPTDGQAYRIPLSMMLPSSPQVPARKHPFTATSHSSAIGKRSREEFEIDGNSDISAPEDNDTLYSFDFAEDEDQSRPSKLVKLKIDREKLRKLNDEVFYRQSDLQNTPWSATVSSDYNVSTSVVDARSSQGPPPTETLENNHPHDIINNDIEPLTHISLDMCIIPMAFTTENEPTTDLAFPTRNEPPLPSQFSSAAQRELSQHSTIDSNATCSENHSFQVPVEEMLLRRQVFGTLLSILTSADPPSAVILNLKPLVVDLMNNHKTLNINGEQNQGSSRSDAVFTCWVQMHMQLELFRSTTNYTGAAGKEWVNHCKGLSLWKDEKGPALLALNNLQIWKLNAMKEGLWIPCLDFDYELVTFFIDLTQIPGLLSEDLAEGFALYNKGLLGWFS